MKLFSFFLRVLIAASIAVIPPAFTLYAEPLPTGIETSVLHDGIYVGVSEGKKRQMKVQVTIFDGKIFQVELLQSDMDHCTLPTDAFTKIAPQVINHQDLDVDGVSGATISSKATRNAIQDALEKAKTGS